MTEKEIFIENLKKRTKKFALWSKSRMNRNTGWK
jgi:hypothetical protein